MKIAIIQFPGSNCERETILAVQRAGMTPFEFLWNDPTDQLIACDGYIIVGGFSYEDRSRAGIIAALDPVMAVLISQTARGKPLLGICNGAQILVESGLVPGLEGKAVDIALTHNKRIQQNKILGTGYYNAWIHLKLAKTHVKNAFTRFLTHQSILKIPVANAEGRFVMSHELLDYVETNGMVTFQYCDDHGEIVDEFPVNPNGSVHNIAALSNAAGNVLAIMPHPERTVAGDPLFHSMREFISGRPILVNSVPSMMSEHSADHVLSRYIKADNAHEVIVQLIITDNEAMTVENTLKKMGIAVTIQRQTHWEIIPGSPDDIDNIHGDGLLYNERKEMLVTPPSNTTGQRSILVRAKEDLLGQQMLQHFSNAHHGVLWHIGGEPNMLDSALSQILESHILFNPCSHEGYFYD